MRALLMMLIALCGPALFACCMVPRQYKGDVDQAQQQIVILHDTGHQEMIIRVAPFFQSAPGRRMSRDPDANLDTVGTPPYILWVLTVPSKPTGYALADKAIFRDAVEFHQSLQQQARRQWDEAHPQVLGALGFSAANASTNDAAPRGLAVSGPIAVGPYEITEVRALGLDALRELNRYLRDLGFNEEDEDHMRYFVENNFTFLCVRINPPAGEATLGKQLDLEPLQVGFDTAKPYYPAKFSSRQGNFKAHVQLLTSEPVALADWEEKRQRLADVARDRWPNVWRSSLEKTLAFAAKPIKQFNSVGRWYSNLIASEGFNPTKPDGDPTIWDWKDDVFFALGGDADLPGPWYYGDGPKSFAANVMAHRIHAAMLAVIAAMVVALWLAVRYRIRRNKAQSQPPKTA